MKVKVMKSADFTRAQYVSLCSNAALTATNALDNEGLYNDTPANVLWETAWNAVYNALYDGVEDQAECEYIALSAARRHALAIPGCTLRRKLVRDGRIVPAPHVWSW